ncbi:hypothetical protein [Helicobacter sp. MIT 01-3238]|uniref:hypothetical protein n=1 Tax=Helicobacter sp. MIT 01-3238 TaxID=398627 RepID=UPI000E1F4529|nr:hypothetical protein [Helicobacter sp. MIT 01-3238]RDU53068.1 hypothetical protein CQA40_05925 [Helicobacter sp. MIT 01-3238]
MTKKNITNIATKIPRKCVLIFVCVVLASAISYGEKSKRYLKYEKSSKESTNTATKSQKDSTKSKKDSATKETNKESTKPQKESKTTKSKDKSKQESQDENLIDYSTLSLYYYPYIMAYHKISDKEIASLIKNLDASKKKSGIFIGVYGGWIFHNAAGNTDYVVDNFLAYGAKVGFQSFYPTMFDSISFPNKVGGRIYLQYLGSNAKELNLSSLGFSSIGISADVLIDLPLLPMIKGKNSLEAGAIAGFGLASMIYDSNSDATLGGIINIGASFTLISKHRIEGEIKLIINERLNWFGIMPMVGYSYVF